MFFRFYKKHGKKYKYLSKFYVMRSIRPGSFTDSDPVKLVYVNPGDIKYIHLFNHNYSPAKKCEIGERMFDKYKDMGRVIDGDWDMRKGDYKTYSEIYKLLFERYQLNKAWDDIEIIKAYKSAVAAGRSVWHECKTETDIINRAEKIDVLYNTIKINGYKPQFLIRGNKIRHYFNEITVNIDRYGNFIYHHSGAHRLAIANILTIGTIPVRVLVRHKKWQEIRDSVRINTVSPKILKQYYNHPDLQDVIS